MKRIIPMAAVLVAALLLNSCYTYPPRHHGSHGGFSHREHRRDHRHHDHHDRDHR